MKSISSRYLLLGLLIVSVALNLIQYAYYIRPEVLKNRASLSETLLRLGINRSVIVDAERPDSPNVRLLHGLIMLDLGRLRPEIASFSESRQIEYKNILADLNNYHMNNSENFSADKLLMESAMYDKYIRWISERTTVE